METEQMEIPVAETEYAITPDGTVVEAEEIKENPEAFQETVQ